MFFLHSFTNVLPLHIFTLYIKEICFLITIILTTAPTSNTSMVFSWYRFFLTSLLIHLSSSLPVESLRDSVSTIISLRQERSSLSPNPAADVQSTHYSFSDSNIPSLSSISRSPVRQAPPFLFRAPVPFIQFLGFNGLETSQFFKFCVKQCGQVTGRKCIRRKVPLQKLHTCRKSASFGFVRLPTCCFWSSCFNLVGVSRMSNNKKNEGLWLKKALERSCKGMNAAKV